MKKLLASPKFWAITFGTLLGSGIYYLLGDGEGLNNTFPMLVVGAFAGIGAMGKAEDIVKSYKNNGTT